MWLVVLEAHVKRTYMDVHSWSTRARCDFALGRQQGGHRGGCSACKPVRHGTTFFVEGLAEEVRCFHIFELKGEIEILFGCFSDGREDNEAKP